MSNQSEAKPDVFDFDFDAEELMSEHVRSDSATASHDEAGLTRGGLDDDLGPPPREPNRSEATIESSEPPKKGKSTLLLIVLAVVITLALLGGLGWFALQILAPADPPNQSAPTGQTSNSGFPVSNGTGIGQASNTNQFESMAQQASNNGWETVQTENQGMTFANEYGGLEQNLQSADTDTSILIDSGLPVEESVAVDVYAQDEKALTEEEKLYDDLLEKASALDVVPEAIVIDENVVRRELESRRVQDLEKQIVATRSSIKTIREAVTGMQGHVSELALIVEAGSESQAELAKSVDAISSAVEAIKRERQSDIKTLTDGLKRLEAKTDEVQNSVLQNPPVAASAPAAPTVATPIQQPVKPEVAAAPNKPTLQHAVAKPAAVTASTETAPAPQAAKPATVAAVTANPENQGTPEVKETANECPSTRVSAVWRVRGVNSTSAYITRPQDRTGLFIREGVEVPGFGTVLSFEPLTRTICTTSGLIKR